MDKNHGLKSDWECSVCGRCVLSCPNHAIHFRCASINYEPVIDTDKCLDCHICEMVCKKEIKKDSSWQKVNHYVCTSRDDDILKRSSSGGIFSEIARYILQQGGIVIGAYFDSYSYEVKHIAVENEKDLDLCRKSKYVQSNPEISYDAISRAMDEKRWILFTGTPCQVEPIFYIFEDYNKLICVDLFCHGVSNGGIFKKYLESFSVDVRTIDFRDNSSADDTNFNMKYVFVDGTKLVNNCNSDILYQSWIWSMNIKKECLSCQFSSNRHHSDLTIGDWNDKDFAREHGIEVEHPSIVAINSKKGKDIWNKIQYRISSSYITEKDLIQDYYSEHDTCGAWGYDEELAKTFIKYYLQHGFIRAFYELRYPFEMKLLERVTINTDSIWLYGAGILGHRIYDMIKQLFPQWRVKGFVISEEHFQDELYGDLQIKNVRNVEFSDDDIVVIAVSNEVDRQDIYNTLSNSGINYIVS